MRRSARSMRLQPAKPTAANAMIAAAQASTRPSRKVVQPAGRLRFGAGIELDGQGGHGPVGTEPARRPSPGRVERRGTFRTAFLSSASSLGQSTRRPGRPLVIDLRGADEDEHLRAVQGIHLGRSTRGESRSAGPSSEPGQWHFRTSRIRQTDARCGRRGWFSDFECVLRPSIGRAFGGRVFVGLVEHLAELRFIRPCEPVGEFVGEEGPVAHVEFVAGAVRASSSRLGLVHTDRSAFR